MRAFVGFTLVVPLLFAAVSRAAWPVFDVNSTFDAPDAAIDGDCKAASGLCTLRAAIMEASSFPNPTGEEVTINLPAGTYDLSRPIGANDDETNGDLNLYGKIEIVGKGFDLSIIDAKGLDRAIAVGSNAVVTLSDLRVQGGQPPDSFLRFGSGNGGGIYNEGDLTLVRCLVRANQVSSTWWGGGIYSNGGFLTLRDSVVRVNNVPNGDGGGIYSKISTTTISRSTINANTASYGGGMFVEDGTLRIVNSTISQNAASVDGAGIYLFAIGDAALNNVTVATNTASGTYPAGSGIYATASTVFLPNSIVASASGGAVTCYGGSSVYPGFSVIFGGTNCAIDTSYITVDPLLGEAGIYGGSTVTHSLLANSPAINAGDDGFFGCADADGNPLTTDQRGVMRTIGGRCDIGAFEVEPIGDADGDGVIDVADVFYLINFLFAGGPAPHGRANTDSSVDSVIDVSDVFYLINYLFAAGPAPA